MSDLELVKEAPEGSEDELGLTEEASEDELIDLGALSIEDLSDLLPEQCSLSVANMGERGWTVILRPLQQEAPRLLVPGHVARSQTPIIAGGKTVGGAVTMAFSMVAPDGMRCPKCGEFSLEKLADVAGSETWIECLTCGKKYAGEH
jgi:hypothetical protein